MLPSAAAARLPHARLTPWCLRMWAAQSADPRNRCSRFACSWSFTRSKGVEMTAATGPQTAPATGTLQSKPSEPKERCEG